MRDITTLLRDADPSPDTPAYTDTERARILSAATATSRSSGKTWWRVGAVAAAATLVTAIGVINLGGPGGATAAANDVLTQAAINAVDPPVRPDQWWEITRSSVNEQDLEGAPCLIASERTDWLVVDGSKPLIFVEQPATLSKQLDPTRPCDLSQFNPNPYVMTFDKPPYPGRGVAYFAGLPRDRAELRKIIMELAARPDDDNHAQAHTVIHDMLSTGLVPADLRTAMFDVMKTIPGVDVTSDEMVSGRRVVGLGIKIRYGYGKQIWWIPRPASSSVSGTPVSMVRCGTRRR